jgi:hypothetical protein
MDRSGVDRTGVLFVHFEAELSDVSFVVEDQVLVLQAVQPAVSPRELDKHISILNPAPGYSLY